MSSDSLRPEANTTPAVPPPSVPDPAATLLPSSPDLDSGSTQPLSNPGVDPNAATLGPSSSELAQVRDALTASEDAIPPELQNHPRYRVIRLLGRGGMGAVFLAEHKMMNRKVALKLVNTELLNSTDAIQRFHREIQASARLTHTNIVSAYDADQAGSIHFLVMEYIEGETLADLLKRHKKMAVSTACELIRQTALGLQYAHERNMIHRDIKPHNLMRTHDGVVKILDFGLARFASEQQTPASSQTASGVIMGTADYIAPEQTRGGKAVDIRADIYSLGCTLYHLLSGEVPFPDGTVIDKMIRQAMDPARPLSAVRADVPLAVEVIVRRMMAKDPNDRYQTPGEVAEVLTELAAGKPVEEPAPRPRPPKLSGARDGVSRRDSDLVKTERLERETRDERPERRTPKSTPPTPRQRGNFLPTTLGWLSLLLGMLSATASPSLCCCGFPAGWQVLIGIVIGLFLATAGLLFSLKSDRSGMIECIGGLCLNLMSGGLIIFISSSMVSPMFPNKNADSSFFPSFGPGLQITPEASTEPSLPQKQNPIMTQTTGSTRIDIVEVRLVPATPQLAEHYLLRFKIHNLSKTTPLAFTPWSRLPSDTPVGSRPKLNDPRQNLTQLRDESPLSSTLTIPPEKSAEEVLRFGKRTSEITALWLELRMPPLAEKPVSLRFVIPQENIVK